MSSDLDDQWLYGNEAEDVSNPVKAKEQPAGIIKENGNGTVADRPLTPTLDDEEVTLSTPSVPTVSKIVSTAPDLQPKQPSVDNLSPSEDPEVEGGGAEQERAEEEGELEEAGDSDSDDDVEITIGNITTVPGGAVGSAYNRTPSYTRMTGAVSSGTKKMDVDAIPQVGGQSLLDFDLEATIDRPWRLPGSDISDFFNYGFTEETWRLYCEKQRKMRGELTQLNKIVVRSRPGFPNPGFRPVFAPISVPETRSIPSIGMPPPPGIIPGFPPPIHTLPPPFFPPPLGGVPVAIPQPFDNKPEVQGDEGNKTPDPNESKGSGPDNASDGRATPGLDTPSGPPPSTKLPLLPPPNLPPVSAPSLPPQLPPPFGMPPPGFPGMPPPSQDNIAAAMAAMFGGGIRPPDLRNLPHPPHMPHNIAHFPPHGFHAHEAIMPPPFPGMGPPFSMPGGDHAQLLDDRNLGLPPEMTRLLSQFPWDPSMGPPPPELLEAFAHREQHRASRSRSRSSSLSRSRSRSRSSSYEDRTKMSGRRKERRHRRSRSKSYDRERERDREKERDRHRSSRHHRNGRSDRHERERDRERDNRERERERERDRESRKRKEHREDKPRHERSSRRHRSSSRGKDEERSSRKEKAKVEQEQGRESRSRSRTPT